MQVEAAEHLVDEKEQVFVDECLGDHAQLQAVGNHSLEQPVVEVVHDNLQLLDHPVNYSDPILVHLSIVKEHKTAEVMLEDVPSVLLLQLRQGLPLLVVLSLPDEHGQVRWNSPEKGDLGWVIVFVQELIHDFLVRVSFRRCVDFHF